MADFLVELELKIKKLDRLQELIGLTIVSYIQKKMIKQNKRWITPKTSEATLKSRKQAKVKGWGKGKSLVNTGRLVKSIYHKRSKHSVKIGSDLVYAAIHQHGGNILQNVIIPEHLRKRKKKRKKKGEDKTFITVHAHARQMDMTIPKRKFVYLDQDLIKIIHKQSEIFLKKELSYTESQIQSYKSRIFK